jgi:outer membrane lipoprotein carrier protein
MKKNSILLIFYFFTFTLFAQTDFKPIPSPEIVEVKNQIKQKNAQITTLTSTFTQTKKMAILKEPSIMKGVMYYKTTDKFRWEYNNNPKFIFAQHGKTISTQTGDNVQVINDNSVKLYEEISKLVAQSINGNILENNKDFTISYEQNGEYIKVDMVPKQRTMKRFIASITLYIDKKTMLASKFIMAEANGDSTTIVFDKILTNTPIEDKLFILKK